MLGKPTNTKSYKRDVYTNIITNFTINNNRIINTKSKYDI